MTRPSVAVVGGGVTGLVAARALSSSADVTLFEASSSLGGKIETAELLGQPIDTGPDAFITRQSAAEELCRALDLADELLAPSSNSVAIFTRGELHEMPKGIVLGVPTHLRALRESNVVGTAAMWRTIRDLVGMNPITPTDALLRAESGEDDRSVEEVFGPRLGNEIVRTLVDPLLGGINASDVSSLSLAACAPQLLKRLEGHRSVMRALRAEPATFGQRPTRPPFLGLRGGMAALVVALETDCRKASVEIRCGDGVSFINRSSSGGWELTASSGVDFFDAVLVTTPATAAAGLLFAFAPEISRELAAIPYASVVTASFSFPGEAVPARTTERLRRVVPGAPSSASSLVGSGVLVPRDGRHLITGATFTSSKWPRSAAEGQIVIRAFAGRHHDERALDLGDAELEKELLGDLREILGIATSPTASLLKRWERALPQYVTGHLARIRRIETLLLECPTLGLAGAAYHGIGIPACIQDGERAASRLLGSLTS